MTPAELEKARKRLGWVQERLSVALGVHRMTVSKWERGVQPIPEMAAIAIRCIAEHSD